jgi:hypothetical protein
VLRVHLLLHSGRVIVFKIWALVSASISLTKIHNPVIHQCYEVLFAAALFILKSPPGIKLCP